MQTGFRPRPLARGLHEVFVDAVSLSRRLDGLSAVSAGRGTSEVLRRIGCQQFRVHVENYPFNGMMATIGVLLWMMALRPYSVGPMMLAWGAAALFVIAVMAALSYSFVRAKPCDQQLRQWEVRLGWLNWVMGMIWGLVGFVVAPNGFSLLPYVAAGSLLVIASSLSLYALYRPSMSWMVVPCAPLTLLSLVWQGGWQQLGTGAMYVVAVGLLVKLARAQNLLMTEAAVSSEERLALLEEIESQRRAAQQANEAKTRFLAAVSHDLRQPMHSIGLLSSALGRQGGDRADVIDQLSAAVQAMDVLLQALSRASAAPSHRVST
jgi:signal transduction histidine kinase